MYHQDGAAIAVAASKAGQPTHPAWFHNLKATPDTTIQIGAFYPGYEFFQRHAKTRQIPIVIFDPR